MSTAEDQRIAALFEDGRQQAFQQCPGLRPVEIAGFDALDQPRTGWVKTCTSLAKRSSKAAKRALFRVPVVARTPTRPLRVAAAAGFTAGSMATSGTCG